MSARNGGEHLCDPELLQLAWTMLEQEWPVLKKMCQIAARKGRLRGDIWEEAMSEVALRLPQFMWTYDPSKGTTLRSHVIGHARWYLYKMFVTERGGGRRHLRLAQSLAAMPLDERLRRSTVQDGHRELFDWSEVQFVLDRIHPFYRSMLQLYFMSGLTYEEIGGVLECSKSAARKRVLEALDVAKLEAQTLRR
jgi:DNA-directed RNA polymerase specialized sigma24 family protein